MFSVIKHYDFRGFQNRALACAVAGRVGSCLGWLRSVGCPWCLEHWARLPHRLGCCPAARPRPLGGMGSRGPDHTLGCVHCLKSQRASQIVKSGYLLS